MRSVPPRWLDLGLCAPVLAMLALLSSATNVTATEAADPVRLHELAESVPHTPWQLAIRERAYRVTDASEHPVAIRAMFAQRWIDLLLELGLTDQALSGWESLPTPVRDRTLDSPFDSGARSHHRQSTVDYGDPRLELAAACILEGRLDLARQLVAEIPVKTKKSPSDADTLVSATFALELGRPDRWEPPEFDDDAARLALVQWHLEPPEADPFGLLVDVMVKFDRGPWFRSGTWQRLFALLAAREGYPSLARHVHRSATWKLDDEWWHLTRQRIPDVVKTPELIAAASRAEDAINGLRDLLEQEARPSTVATPAADIDETIRRLIAAPSIAQLHEQRLPRGMDPVVMTYEQERDHREALRNEHLLPFPHEIVRVEARGDSVVAVGASQDYDPVGELSRGAYWVFRSHDGGARWEPPLYTGLRITMPYVVRPRSDLPMIRRSGLRVEVEVRELDLDHIMFPPVATITKREAVGLYLDLPWELLERDSDGDGLTDLAEERLLTDPHQADTDQDSLNDRIDPLPQVPHRVEMDDRTLLMQAILDNTLGGVPAVVHEVGDLGPDADPGQVARRHRRVTHASERTGFLIGDRASFRGATPARRTIVLSSAEHAAAKEKFGPIFATRYDVLMTNRVGDLAFVVWSAQWRGGEGIVEKIDGQWVYSGLGFWVT